MPLKLKAHAQLLSKLKKPMKFTNDFNLQNVLCTRRLQESDILISGGVPAVEQDQGCGKQVNSNHPKLV